MIANAFKKNLSVKYFTLKSRFPISTSMCTYMYVHVVSLKEKKETNLHTHIRATNSVYCLLHFDISFPFA